MSVIFFEVPGNNPPPEPAIRQALTDEQRRELREDPFWRDCVQLAQETLGACIPAGNRFVPADLRELNAVNHPPGLVPATVLRETILDVLLRQDASGETPDVPPRRESHIGDRISGGDTECLLTQLTSRYVRATGDKDILFEMVGGRRVLDRILAAMDYVWSQRWESHYGLVINRPDGVNKPSIGLHINAAASIAIRELLELPYITPEQRRVWIGRTINLGMAVRSHLWDSDLKRHYPRRISPEGLIAVEESCIHPYASALALQAGFLNETEKALSLRDLLVAMEITQARTPGFSHLPPGPDSPDDLSSLPRQPSEWTTPAAQITAAYAQSGFGLQSLHLLRRIAELCLQHRLFAEKFSPDAPVSAVPSPAAAASFLHAYDVLSPSTPEKSRPPVAQLPTPMAPTSIRMTEKHTPLLVKKTEDRGFLEIPVLLRVEGRHFSSPHFACIVRKGSPTSLTLESPRFLKEDTLVSLQLYLLQQDKQQECHLNGRVNWCQEVTSTHRFSMGIELGKSGKHLQHWQRFLDGVSL
jgi:hypothetical protein